MSVFSIKDDNGKVKTWVAKVNYKTHDGKSAQAQRNARTKPEATRFELDLLTKREKLELNGQKPPTPAEPATLTVEGYLTQWLATRQGLNESTSKRYRELLAPVIREVGSVPIDALTPLQVESVYAGIIKTGRSPKTALNTHRVLKTAFTDAANKRMIPWNPLPAVTAPRAEKFEPLVLTRADLDCVVAAADSTPIGPLVRLLAWTGLRLGEAIALTWNDIDLVAGQLTVRQTLNTVGTLGRPKTQRSRRTIDLSPATVEMLRNVASWQVEDKIKLGQAYDDRGYVFANEAGAPRTQWAVNFAWNGPKSKDGDKPKGIAAKAGVPRARIHDLRHAHATHLLADGWEISAVAERLGHSQTSTTLNVYSHALPKRNAELAQAIDRIFGGDE